MKVKSKQRCQNIVLWMVFCERTSDQFYSFNLIKVNLDMEK